MFWTFGDQRAEAARHDDVSRVTMCDDDDDEGGREHATYNIQHMSHLVTCEVE